MRAQLIIDKRIHYNEYAFRAGLIRTPVSLHRIDIDLWSILGVVIYFIKICTTIILSYVPYRLPSLIYHFNFYILLNLF